MDHAVARDRAAHATTAANPEAVARLTGVALLYRTPDVYPAACCAKGKRIPKIQESWAER
jgi:hypothetical protein